ncbi:methyltransferase domain-containing protein [Bartonella sp. A05]|uniref:methyltransferase domain-containing protein n=1 Tax=Bartonella sp. A05 TaxID=2967261 RepID=UPI0022A94B8A|nr:methyltransferase domain-containing protein [Bartonella sp. A05]MCZ2204441.1 methyltransferase domain-containing protein [Bartonella sp. A05]
MTAQLKQIQARFNKASQSYDNVATIQKNTAEFLINKLFKHQNFIPQTVLDLGTGTGYIPELLLPRFHQSSFYLNDIADEMLKVCKAKFAKATNIYYLPGDMLKLNADIYDYVISNLALQWVDDLHYAIKFFYSKSSHVFAFSTLLDGTFEEWENILNQYQPIQTLNYPKAEELIDLCTKLKKQDQIFEFWLMDVPLSFDNPAAFMGYLKSLGASSSSNLMDLCNLKKLLKAECENLTVTYKIFFGIFRKIS